MFDSFSASFYIHYFLTLINLYKIVKVQLKTIIFYLVDYKIPPSNKTGSYFLKSGVIVLQIQKKKKKKGKKGTHQDFA